ncbi:MAG: 30S ribosome-binding factor RbfA [Ahrensia sp.]|nr:30S ribosome-binding factor RbfA [Ahrensia sp.]
MRKSNEPTQRMLRVGENVRHALTQILQRGQITDPTLDGKVISVTEVRMSPDLQIATVYVTAFGEADMQASGYIKALANNAKFIRGKLSPALRDMKQMPIFRFQPDTSFDNFAKIDAILKSPSVARDLKNDDDNNDNDNESTSE